MPEPAAHAQADSFFLLAGPEAQRPDKDLSVPSSPGFGRVAGGGAGGWSLIRPAHTHPPATTREGLLSPVLPSVPGECRGPCDAVWVLQNLSPSSHLAQADIKIHLHSPCTRLADGGGGGWVRAGGCSQRPSWASRATAECPPTLPHGPSPGWGHSKRWGTSSASQPLRSAGCWDLTFDFSKD